MNSAHSFSEGMDVPEEWRLQTLLLSDCGQATFLNTRIMDLTQKKLELEKEIEQFELAEKEAHEEILKRRAKLRKLALVARDAEELFDIQKELTKV